MIAPEQITHQDELTVEEPNPYRRRQKVIKIRRGEGVQSRLVKFLLVGILLPLALVAAGYGAVRWVLSSPLFYLQPEKDVRLSGNRIISTADVLSALALGNSANGRPVSLFRLDLDAMRRRVESVPWVASATITRVFPHRLDVSVVERTPVAFADVGGRVELVDNGGVLLELVEKAPLDYPVLYGLGSGRDLAQRRAMLAQYEQFLSDTSEAALGSGWTISEVDLSDPADLRVLLVQGRETVLVHFGERDYGQRFRTFVKVAPQVLANNPRIDSMDLRFRDEVVVDPQQEAALSNAAAKPTLAAASSPAAPHAKAARGRRRRRAVRR